MSKKTKNDFESENEQEDTLESAETESEMETSGVDVENTEVTETAPTVEVSPVKRPRGRPKGVKVGRRPRIWDCAAIVDGELVHERISAPDSITEEQRGSFPIEQAKALFKDIYGTEPLSVHGPYYDQKGDSTISIPKKRETVSISLPALNMKRENAIFKGWRGIAWGIEGREDVVYFMFGEEIEPSSDKKRTVPPARAVYRNVLQFEQTAGEDS